MKQGAESDDSGGDAAPPRGAARLGAGGLVDRDERHVRRFQAEVEREIEGRRVLAAPHHPGGHVEDPRTVSQDDLIERPTVSALGQGDELPGGSAAVSERGLCLMFAPRRSPPDSRRGRP